MNPFIKLILNRNFILIAAVLLGLFFPFFAKYLEKYTLFFLAFSMIFATTGFDLKMFSKINEVLKITGYSIFLNYFLYGLFLLIPGYFFISDSNIFLGLVIIVASPPGAAIIPFSYILNGNIKYSVIGVAGASIAAIFLTPVIIRFFAPTTDVNPVKILIIVLITIILPLILSRFLTHKKIYNKIQIVRGKIVDYCFAIIIYTAIGVNNDIFFSSSGILITVSLVIVISMFFSGLLYEYLAIKKKTDKTTARTQNLLLTIKSSGFSAATALSLFGKEAAIPSAILSIAVLLYLLFLNIRLNFNSLNN